MHTKAGGAELVSSGHRLKARPEGMSAATGPRATQERRSARTRTDFTKEKNTKSKRKRSSFVPVRTFGVGYLRMKITIQNPPDNGATLMKRAGYSMYTDRNTGLTSFSNRLGPDFFPKFHAYIEEAPGVLTINLHLDQKKPSYEGTPMHGGEYSGTMVEEEAKRVEAFIASYQKPEDLAPKTKPGFFAKLFGRDDSAW